MENKKNKPDEHPQQNVPRIEVPQSNYLYLIKSEQKIKVHVFVCN